MQLSKDDYKHSHFYIYKVYAIVSMNVPSPRASVLGTILGARNRTDNKTEIFLPSWNIDFSQGRWTKTRQ